MLMLINDANIFGNMCFRATKNLSDTHLNDT